MSALTGPTGWFGNDHASLRRCWHPVAAAASVGDAPVAVELLGEPWCVVRLDGVLTAFIDRCPHRLAPLSQGAVVDGTLQCGYHGYRFDATGRCVLIPAIGAGSAIPPKAHCATAACVTEHLGLIWLALEDPITPLPQVPEFDDPTFTRIELPPWDWNASAGQMADNFLDVAHFPYLHLATFGAPDDTEVGPYEVRRDGWQFWVDYSHPTKALGDSFEQAGEEGYAVHVRHDFYEFTAPHHVYLRISYPSEATVLTITFFHQPLGPGRTRLWCCDYRNDIPDEPAAIAAAAAFQQAVGFEDKALLETLAVKATPIDATFEVHTRADRITLELRRILTDLAAVV